MAICHNGASIPRKTAQSLMEIGWGDRIQRAKDAHGFTEVSFNWYTTFPRVDALRDAAVDHARAEGFSHLLFLDADMIWPTDVLERMLRHHSAGIVGGLYVMRHPPYAPVALRDRFRADGSQVDQFYHALIEGADLIPVDVLGMGCTLIPLDIIDRMGPRPWFEYRDDDAGWPVVTEDVPFCLKAKDVGAAVWLDPTVRCGHVMEQVTDVRWWDRWQKQAADVREAMPIRVVTRSEAEAQPCPP